MFLLCLIGLGESRIHHPRRPHYWGHYYDRNDACISKVTNEDVPLQILTLRSNQQESIEYVDSLDAVKTLIEMEHPLLVNKKLNVDGERIIAGNVDQKEGSYYVDFETLQITKSGKELKAVFRKGFVDCKYETYLKTIREKYCDGQLTGTQTTFSKRQITEKELQTIIDLVKIKMTQ